MRTIEHEKETNGKITTLRKMVEAFSMAMWERMNERFKLDRGLGKSTNFVAHPDEI